jgi:DnaJ-class molecular chaperone
MENAAEIQDDDFEPSCPTCGASMHWDDCSECGGEGWVEHEGDADDPWESIVVCDQCDGIGGYYICIAKHEGEP